MSFIALNDGTTLNNIQIVAEHNISEGTLKLINTGSSLPSLENWFNQRFKPSCGGSS